MPFERRRLHSQHLVSTLAIIKSASNSAWKIWREIAGRHFTMPILIKMVNFTHCCQDTYLAIPKYNATGGYILRIYKKNERQSQLQQNGLQKPKKMNEMRVLFLEQTKVTHWYQPGKIIIPRKPSCLVFSSCEVSLDSARSFPGILLSPFLTPFVPRLSWLTGERPMIA